MFHGIPNRREIALISNPSPRSNRRVSAQFSKLITHQSWSMGQNSLLDTWSVFSDRRYFSNPSRVLAECKTHQERDWIRADPRRFPTETSPSMAQLSCTLILLPEPTGCVLSQRSPIPSPDGTDFQLAVDDSLWSSNKGSRRLSAKFLLSASWCLVIRCAGRNNSNPGVLNFGAF